MSRLRARTYRLLFDRESGRSTPDRFESFIALLITANLLATLAEHVPALHHGREVAFLAFEQLSVAFFALEYLLRLYAAPEDPSHAGSRLPRLHYATRPLALVDLVAILPLLVQAATTMDLRLLRLLRFLRLFKLARVAGPAMAEFRALNAGRSLRQRVHALVWRSERGGRLQQWFDIFIVMAVLVSVFEVVLESVAEVQYVLNLEFVVLDSLTVAVFALEYLMRLYAAPEEYPAMRAWRARWTFVRSPSAVIDLLAIAPFFIEAFVHHLFDLRFLRVFRLLRLLKLTRYTSATRTLVLVLRREAPVIGASAFVMMLLVVLTASLGYLLEHEAQPDKFENIPAAMYWAVITLASVGYGDIAPITPAGRAMTIVLALLGIGIFAIPAALLASAFSDQLRSEREALQNELYDMLADGVISAEEQARIDQEAKRLHLSASEVQRLLERAQREHQQVEVHAGLLPVTQVQGNPQLAIDFYRAQLAVLRQLAQLADPFAMNVLLADVSRATSLERLIWSVLREDIAAAQSPPTASSSGGSGAGTPRSRAS